MEYNQKTKELQFNDQCRKELKQGVDTLAKAVIKTLGPKGRNVIIERENDDPIITKDGVTVAKEIKLKDPIQNLGVQLIKGVASKTNDETGDGTTTATLLTNEILKEGFRYIENNNGNPIEVKRGIDIATEDAIKYIQDNLKKIIDTDNNSIQQIATISANNDTVIGELIAETIKKIGKDGVVSIEENTGFETTLDVVEGLQFWKGYCSPYFITNTDKGTVDFDKCLVMIYNDKLSNLNDFIPILEKVIQINKPLLIITDDISSEILSTLVVNKIRTGLSVVAVKSPEYGQRRREVLMDIAALTGGTIINKETGLDLKDVTPEHLGQVNKLIVNKDKTTLIDGAGKKEDIEKRITHIQELIKNTSTPFEQEYLQERLAKLVGGVAVLKIGGGSEVEIKEKKDRVDDAVHATKAALEEGIIPGGGLSYIRASEYLENNIKNHKYDNLGTDEMAGISIIKNILKKPLFQICENAGVSGDVVFANIINSTDINYGFNAKTYEYGNLIEQGVLDPFKVTKVALQNAVSVASMIMTTDCSITILRDEVKNQENIQQ
jgi:chaperonin GroEL